MGEQQERLLRRRRGGVEECGSRYHLFRFPHSTTQVIIVIKLRSRFWRSDGRGVKGEGGVRIVHVYETTHTD